MGLAELLCLYIAFRIKHLLCDFIQPYWVAVSKGKSLKGIGGKALAFHAGAHALGTTIVTLIFAPQFWWLGIVDLAIHGIIDRVKSCIVDNREWPMTSMKFWFVFGLDQEAHNLTHLAYIVFIFMSLNPELSLIQ